MCPNDERERPSPERSRRAVLCSAAGGLSFVAGCSSDSGPATSRKPSSGAGQPLAERLDAIAADTYAFFEAFTDDGTGLVADRVDGPPDSPTPVWRSSPANVGLQLLAEVSASVLGIVDSGTAAKRVGRVLETLVSLSTWNGLYHRWYRTANGRIDREFDGGFVSTVDNGWLAAGVLVAGQAFPEHRQRASAIVASMDFGAVFDPSVDNAYAGTDDPGRFHGGYDPNTGLSAWHYGTFNAESRVASYVAIGAGDVPTAHWWSPYRTFPSSFESNQDANGIFRTYDGVRVFEGHYEHDGVTFVPSWGGSLFESLMPALVLREPELGIDALGKNGRRHARLHVRHAAERGYDAWGFSPCATHDGYGAFGVDATGVSGYDNDEYVTPHATLLALEFAPERAVQAALETYLDWGMTTEYGLYDSARVATGDPTRSWLALDQGMSLAAIANYRTGGRLRTLLASDPIGSEPTALLAREQFTWGPQ